MTTDEIIYCDNQDGQHDYDDETPGAAYVTLSDSGADGEGGIIGKAICAGCFGSDREWMDVPEVEIVSMEGMGRCEFPGGDAHVAPVETLRRTEQVWHGFGGSTRCYRPLLCDECWKESICQVEDCRQQQGHQGSCAVHSAESRCNLCAA